MTDVLLSSAELKEEKPPGIHSRRSPGEGNGYPLQYSWVENSKHRGAWQAQAHGVARSQTQLSDFHFQVLALLAAASCSPNVSRVRENRGLECLSLSNAVEQRFKASSTLADPGRWLNHQGCQGHPWVLRAWPGVLSPLRLTSLTLCAPTLRNSGCKHTFTLFLDPKGGPNHASIS